MLKGDAPGPETLGEEIPAAETHNVEDDECGRGFDLAEQAPAADRSEIGAARKVEDHELAVENCVGRDAGGQPGQLGESVSEVGAPSAPDRHPTVDMDEGPEPVPLRLVGPARVAVGRERTRGGEHRIEGAGHKSKVPASRVR